MTVLSELPDTTDLLTLLTRLEERLTNVDKKIDQLSVTKRKTMEWIQTLSEHLDSLDDFREEVRACLEPLLTKMENIEEVARILRHATSDVSKRVETLEVSLRKVS